MAIGQEKRGECRDKDHHGQPVVNTMPRGGSVTLAF